MVPDEFLDINYSFVICPICQDRFEEPILQCSSGHCFCSKCIEEWMDRNSTCPTCRKTISSHSLSRNLLIEQAIEELVNNHQIAEIITKKEKRHSWTPRRQLISRKAKNYCKFIYLNLFFAFIFVVIAFTYHEGNKIDVKKRGHTKDKIPIIWIKEKGASQWSSTGAYFSLGSRVLCCSPISRRWRICFLEYWERNNNY